MRGPDGLVDSCSNNGDCVISPDVSRFPTGMCVCDEGWTGVGDFMNGAGLDCQINTATIKAWWAVIAAVTLGQILFGCNVLNLMKGTGKKITEGMGFVILVSISGASLRIIEAIIRVITGEQNNALPAHPLPFL